MLHLLCIQAEESYDSNVSPICQNGLCANVCDTNRHLITTINTILALPLSFLRCTHKHTLTLFIMLVEAFFGAVDNVSPLPCDCTLFRPFSMYTFANCYWQQNNSFNRTHVHVRFMLQCLECILSTLSFTLSGSIRLLHFNV